MKPKFSMKRPLLQLFQSLSIRLLLVQTQPQKTAQSNQESSMSTIAKKTKTTFCSITKSSRHLLPTQRRQSNPRLLSSHQTQPQIYQSPSTGFPPASTYY